ncbi:ketopantoate reductase family protein [Halomicrobium sp. LC1Hm]|uniref:ketopantoate reductase family protein n=1 Tax=Halomicrobium sp. LC1Hm TaxID=2610902 RepID=UPI0012982651|nr:ketopantoate reductase family protein [Halomicrobium sp. LC1Hm]QGA81208.1 Ketopantoate reductase [Halomicrobium sp. LC1Hm]
MDVFVFGAGSLGSLIGGLLARSHDVTLVGREPHVRTVERSGLTVEGAIEAHVGPAAGTTPPAAAALAVVTVTAGDTDAAAAALSDTALDACLSLQNGMGNEATLAQRLDCPVLAGTCTYGARLTEPGVVACTGVGEVVLGPREGGHSAPADRAGAAFTDAGVETTVADDMPRRLWEKLAVNAGINATTALARVPNGALVDGPARRVAERAARETAAVAREHGVDLSDERAAEAMAQVATDTAANHSSMLQDVADGRQTEIDAINGYVVEQSADVAVPVNETLTALVRAWESS